MTVLGAVAPYELGATLLHEHLIFDLRFSNPDPDRCMTDPDAAVEDMRLLYEVGGRSVVEQTCQGFGRDPSLLRRIAQQCDVHIIASTGFYGAATYPTYVQEESAEQLAARLVRDVEQGIDDTDVRAGMIGEIATEGDASFTAAQIKVYRAVATAQQATGLGISAHCWLGNGAVRLIDLLTADGVPAERVLVHHVGANRASIDTATAILDTGARVMVDCVGYGERDGFIGWDDRDRAMLVSQLFDRGYGQQVTVSKHLCRRAHFSRFGGHGHRFVLLQFVPMLREAGLTDGEIDTLLVHTPRKFLTPDR